MKYSEDLKKAISKDLQVEENDSIKIGGLCMCFKEQNTMKDKTLDNALNEQKCEFNNSCCLKLD